MAYLCRRTAPHRIMFSGGALQTFAVMLWWLIKLVTRYGMAGHPIAWTIAPVAAHTYLMIYGLLLCLVILCSCGSLAGALCALGVVLPATLLANACRWPARLT